MVVLWCAAIASGVMVATQSAPPTWLAGSWVAMCTALAVWATAVYQIAQKRRQRWDAGDYTQE
jgi:hypothetical protein